MTATTVPSTILGSIRALVDYSWADEERDFEECQRNGDGTEGHIFLHIEALNNWLDDGAYVASAEKRINS